MAPETIGALVDRHIMALAQKPGCRQSRNSGPNDRNLEANIGDHDIGLSNAL
jgi:hypothetical protein